MKGALVLFCAILALVNGQSTQVSQCTVNQGDLPININIHGCTTPPCVFPQLTYAVMDIIFRAPRTMTSMRTLVTAYLSIGPITIPVPYDLEENALTCNFLVNSYCPVLEGEVLVYNLNMFIESLFPVGTSTTLEFRVVDQDSGPVVCIRVPIRIDPPLSGLAITDDNDQVALESMVAF